jgi:cupin fold WbuC family metalloprotein
LGCTFEDTMETMAMCTKTIDAALLDDMLEQAHRSPRGRAMRRLHDDDWEHAHRMLNALTPATFVGPHRHESRYHGEGAILLRGRVAVLIFDDDGNVVHERSCVLSQAVGRIGVDIEPMVWHGLVVLEDSVLYEVKGQPVGGYVAAGDKTFAPWAPLEGAAGVPAYLGRLSAIAHAL